jgi:SAM-dependent methyltransferase
VNKSKAVKAETYWNEVWSLDPLGNHMPLLTHHLNLQISRGKKVLEVGCGPMHTTKAYWVLDDSDDPKRPKIRDKVFVGVDISSVALECASKNFPKGQYIKASATSLPFDSNSFDIVSSFDTLSALGADATKAFTEFVRVAKEGIVLSVTHSDYYIRRENAPVTGEFEYGTLVNYKNMTNAGFTKLSLFGLIRKYSRDKLPNVQVKVWKESELIRMYLPNMFDDSTECNGHGADHHNVDAFISAVIRK